MSSEKARTPAACTIAFSDGGGRGGMRMSYNINGRHKSFEHPSPGFNSVSLKNMLGKARVILDPLSKKYGTLLEAGGDQLTCRPEKVKDTWLELAQWGRDLYREFFYVNREVRHPEIESLRVTVAGLEAGSRIVIDGGGGNLPWGLMYDDKVPDKGSEDFFEQMASHFWALRYQLELLPEYPETSLLWSHVLNNDEETRIAATVNKDIEERYGERQIDYFSGLGNKFRFQSVADPPSVRLFERKKEVLDYFSGRREPQHLFYFFCHHKKGDKMTGRGWYEFGDTSLVVRGSGRNNDEVLSVQELWRKEEDVPAFVRTHPVIFMNACESSQTEVGDPSSFMLYFVSKLSAGAFVGTEALIPAAFADAFGRRFVEEFLSGHHIGRILFEARRHYAQKHYNPFGLYYTLYGDGDIRLSQAVEAAPPPPPS